MWISCWFKVRATVLLTHTVTNQPVVLHTSTSRTCVWLVTTAPYYNSNQCCCWVVQSCVIKKNCEWIGSAYSVNLLAQVYNAFRRGVHSSHQFFGEVTNQITNFKSPFFLFQVIKMCWMIQLWLRVRNVYRNWIIQHILVTWNRKIGDLKLVTWLVTSPKNWWLEWTPCLKEWWLFSS